MAVRYILAAYTRRAMVRAIYESLEDGSYVGRIPGCTGVIACGGTLTACEQELRARFEEWVRLGLSQGRPHPRGRRYLRAS